MATKTRRSRAARTLTTLGVMVVALIGAVLAGSQWSNASLTPQLALDLEGGTQIILTPVPENEEQVTEDTIAQTIEIIRQRVDASGVAEAEITSQGGSNVVVALPGEPDEETLALVRESAQMLFRPVLTMAGPAPVESVEGEAEEDAAGGDAEATDEEGTEDEATDGATADEGAADEGGEATDEEATEQEGPEPTNPSDLAWLTEDLLEEFTAYDCTDQENLTGGPHLVGNPEEPVVACDATGGAKYVLGPVEVQGADVASATSAFHTGPTGASTNERVVNIDFDSEGTRLFREVTTRLVNLEPPRDQFAMVLDGLVISAPQVNNIITDGNAEISGNFDRESAATLAQQLNFGALPLTFEVQSEQQISATLGSEQLQRGLLAGLIGLALVGVYSLLQYRTLGLLTIGSLALAGVIAYTVITFLSWTQGYRLSLPGVAGLIVAIGITADSFIVYFERIRDELRDGKTLVVAVEAAWDRAKRTILASDAVSLLAAVVLYFLAVGGVRGFAFTLGLTTVVDFIVVFLFTHPVMTLLARTNFFGQGHRFSGLTPTAVHTRSRYVGRGRVVAPDQPADRAGRAASAPTASTEDAAPDAVPAGAGRMTIAERKAAERRARHEAGQVDTPADGKDA